MIRLLFAGLVISCSAHAGYLYQRQITLGGAGQIPTSQANFTVFVCANATMGNGNACASVPGLNQTGTGAHVTSAAGYDIIFSSTMCSSPTLLAWNMELYTASTGAMLAHVLLPTLAASGALYICYGNSAVSSFQGALGGAAWDTSYVSVWHLADTSFPATDSAGSFNTSNGAATFGTAGQIGNGVTLGTAATQFLGVLQTPNNGAITMEAWINTSASAVGLWLYGDQWPPTSQTAFDRQVFLDGNGKLNWHVYNGATVIAGPSSASFSDGNWHHIAAVIDTSAGLILYADGTSVATNAGGTNGYNGFANPRIIFGAAGGTALAQPAGMSGAIDEMRVSSVARSANWIKTEFDNQSAPAAFLSYGPEGTVPQSASRSILTVIE